ncbi:MAG: hypothetical protein QGG19_03310, partial [Alphaproteobacteria bacterium]|nr:hypothetical protein [Alphaproteobacteria bacterium]MDP6253455.1 hypothetical protein [Alphaproteobacteria bacterium]MDP7229981.1 hypothetical protein [Alphaproteobacteria bacterium]
LYFSHETQHYEVLLVDYPVRSSGMLRAWRDALALFCQTLPRRVYHQPWKFIAYQSNFHLLAA